MGQRSALPNVSTSFPPQNWGSPKASHIKPSHPHFPHFPRFRVRIFRIFRGFRVFARWNLLRPLFFWGERDRPHFPHFRRFGFESLISKIRPTGFIMTGLRWPGETLKMGTPKSASKRDGPGNSGGKFRLSVEFPQKPLVQGIPGNSFWGHHFGDLAGGELMVIWKGWFETVLCRATLATPFPALCPRILGTRFTNYGLRVFWGELMVIWKGWSETVPCRATLATPFSALCPRILGTRFTNYGLRVSGLGGFLGSLKREWPKLICWAEVRPR